MRLTKKQTIAIDYLEDGETSEVIYGGAAGGAKSTLGCYWQLKRRIKYPGTRGLIARERFKTLKDTTLKTFFEVAKKQGIKRGTHFELTGSNDKENPNAIEFANGSLIFLRQLKYMPSDDDFDDLGSLEITDAFIDEIAQVTYKAKDTVMSRIRFMLDEFNLTPKLLGTCNPTKNWVYNTVYKPWRKETLSADKKFVLALPGDNPYLPKSYLKVLRGLPTAMRERLYYGNWEYDDDPNALIDFEAIGDLYENSHVLPGAKAMTCDIALRGSDVFKIYVWSGWQVIAIYSIDKCSGKEVVDKIKEVKKRHAVPNSRIVYDADGVGAFIGGRNGYLPGAKEFHNGAAPIKEKSESAGRKLNYENLKTQCYYQISKRINDRGIWIKCSIDQDYRDRITAELEQIKERDRDKDGKLKIKRKEEVKLDLGRSPDDSDALMMREYLELASGTPFPDFL